jgi:methyl-accepting chemotaxis protein
MAEIASASQQQNQGIDQVNIAVEQMNLVTQETAANAEETAGTAKELSRQAEEMRIMVRDFHLSDSPLAAALQGEKVKGQLMPRPEMFKNSPQSSSSHELCNV